MNPFPAPKTVLVVDNAAEHNRVQMFLLCARFGVILLFISVYSFDFNPFLELVFGIAAKRNMESLGCNTDNRLLPEHLRYHLWNAITSLCRSLQQHVRTLFFDISDSSGNKSKCCKWRFL